MLKVDRSSVPVPNNLQNLSSDQLSHLSNHLKISTSIYGHDDVKRSLKLLYNKKCYICECDIGDNYDIEHYLPKKHFSNLGYTWSNLHKVCPKCNLAKENKIFFEFDPANSKKVIDILLLDPSSQAYNIHDYISSDLFGKVCIENTGTDPHIKRKAQMTADFLNGELKKSKGIPFEHIVDVYRKRKDRISTFERTLYNHGKPIIDNAVQISSMLSSYVAQTDDASRKLDIDTYRCLANLETMYLNNGAEFSSFIRNYTTLRFGLRYSDILDVIKKLREIYNIH